MSDHRTAPQHPQPPAHRTLAGDLARLRSALPGAPGTSGGDTTAPARRLSRRRLLLGAAAAGGLTLVGTSAASSTPAFAAGVARPEIISAKTWGAVPAQGELPLLLRRPTHLVIHHTTHANSAQRSDAAAHALARKLQRNHQHNGWRDTGQQFTIARGGQALEGRLGSLSALTRGDRFIEGAHAYGFNDQSVGIEVDGTFMTSLPTQAQWDMLVHLSAYICSQYGIAPRDIIAHRDVPGAQTHCCGDALYARMSELRSAVTTALNTGVVGDAGSDGSRDYPTVRRGDSGDAVRRVQITLAGIGFGPGAADGVFGAATEKALRAYQSSIGTGVDGVAGPKTWGALATHYADAATVSTGDSGTTVEYLQRGLSATGQSLAADGSFGNQTAAAVRDYQRSRGLAVDGVAGAQTWDALKHGR